MARKSRDSENGVRNPISPRARNPKKTPLHVNLANRPRCVVVCGLFFRTDVTTLSESLKPFSGHRRREGQVRQITARFIDFNVRRRHSFSESHHKSSTLLTMSFARPTARAIRQLAAKRTLTTAAAARATAFAPVTATAARRTPAIIAQRGVKTIDFAGTPEQVWERSDWPLEKLQE